MGYTVLNRHGVIQIQGATLEEAAREVLGYDSHTWEIRDRELWVSHASRANHGFSRFAGDDGLDRSSISGDTESEIFEKVIKNASWWNNCEVMTDEEYTTMQEPKNAPPNVNCPTAK